MSKAKCLKCNDIIESKHRHDFVRCSCNEIFLDGGDEYIRAGANDLNNILIENDNEFFAALDRDEVLQKLIQEAEIDDMFDDQGYLDDDFDDYNLGVQAGTLDERERIIKLLEEHLCTFTDTEIVKCWCGSFNDAIALIKGETND